MNIRGNGNLYPIVRLNISKITLIICVPYQIKSCNSVIFKIAGKLVWHFSFYLIYFNIKSFLNHSQILNQKPSTIPCGQAASVFTVQAISFLLFRHFLVWAKIAKLLMKPLALILFCLHLQLKQRFLIFFPFDDLNMKMILASRRSCLQ